MKKTVLASIAAIMMIACGDDSGNNTNSQNESSQAYKVPTIYELGTCSAQNNGQSILVESESAYYICSNNEWKKESIVYFDEYGNMLLSSSSLVEISSNSEEDMTAPSCETCEYSSLTDDRDGQTYRTVKIGSQWWMAENLNFDYQVNGVSYGSYCYADDPENCQKYGRLYTRGAKGDSASLYGTGSRGICPKGWHVPDSIEFNTLFKYVGEYAGTHLKAKTGWESNGEGEDTYGFRILPAGMKIVGERFCEDFDYQAKKMNGKECLDSYRSFVEGYGYIYDSTLYYLGIENFSALWNRSEELWYRPGYSDIAYRIYNFFSLLNIKHNGAYSYDLDFPSKSLGYAFSLRCIKD